MIDFNLNTVSALNSSNQTAVYRDASHKSILVQASVRQTSHLILTLPHSADRVAIVTAAKTLNPGIRILVRTRYLREREDLERAGVAAAMFEEAEAAVALARLVLTDTGVHREAAKEKVRDLQLQLVLKNLSTIRTQRMRSIMMP